MREGQAFDSCMSSAASDNQKWEPAEWKPGSDLYLGVGGDLAGKITGKAWEIAAGLSTAQDWCAEENEWKLKEWICGLTGVKILHVLGILLMMDVDGDCRIWPLQVHLGLKLNQERQQCMK